MFTRFILNAHARSMSQPTVITVFLAISLTLVLDFNSSPFFSGPKWNLRALCTLIASRCPCSFGVLPYRCIEVFAEQNVYIIHNVDIELYKEINKIIV